MKIELQKIFFSLIFLIFILVFTSTGYFTNFLNKFTTNYGPELEKNLLSNVWSKITGAQIGGGGGFVGGGAGGIGGSGGGSHGGGAPPGGGGDENGFTPPEDISPLPSGGGKKPRNETNESLTEPRIYGICENGECKIMEGEGESQCDYNFECLPGKKEKALFCEDSEKSESYPLGNNPFQKGITRAGEEKQIDNCISEEILEEWQCNPSNPLIIESVLVNCKVLGVNYNCVDGFCIEKNLELCDDSDGEDFFKKGRVKTKDGFLREDVCIGQTTLQEYICDKKNQPSLIIKHCESPPGAEGCIDGRCVYFEQTYITNQKEKNALTTITGLISKIFGLE